MSPILAALRGLIFRWRARRLEQEQFQALSGLSDATLRDLGLRRGELRSTLTEIHGLAERTRIRAGVSLQIPAGQA